MSAKNLQGLNDDQVLQSRKEHGENVLTPPKRDPWWKLFLEKFEDPVIRILIIAALLSISIGIIHNDYTEGIGIIIAIILATGIAFFNEYKANAAFDILNKVNDDIPVEVIRNGKFISIPSREIVVGDILIASTGQEIPADSEIIKSVNFQISEAKLTGESHSVYKTTREHSKIKEPYPDYIAYKGTVVVDGHATLKVASVGDNSEIGKTAREASMMSGVVTPLNRQLEKLSKLIGVIAFVIAGAIFVALVVHGSFTGDLDLNPSQWIFTSLTLATVLIALTMMWGPVLYDGFDLLKISISPPQWMENGGIKPWIFSLLGGIMIWGVGIAIFTSLKWIPSSPQDWITEKVIVEFLHYFMIAVTIIVVAVPEGLALSVTLCLAYSMRRMIASNNLVRKMHACETIGAATVICSDKTGTLTENNMRVNKYFFPYKEKKETVEEDEWISVSIAVNSTANLDISGEKPSILGNPTEGSLLLWLYQKNINYLDIRNKYDNLKELAFTTENKYMVTVTKYHNKTVLLIKGAPEIILGHCDKIQKSKTLDSIKNDRKNIEKQLVEYQNKGMRTIGFGYKELEDFSHNTDITKLVESINWLGFVAISDPIRQDVPGAIQTCMEAGVKIKIITGDNEKTAKEIAKQINLWQPEDEKKEHVLVSGSEFEQWSEEKVDKLAANIKVLYRARPMNKLHLVKSLQKQKEVVAVTGDGVNDAPALNHADVGLAMGKAGTAIAKEASDIVLLDDSFASITKAILWGRSLYQNIQRFLVFQLTINVAALGIAFLGPFVGISFPLTVMQMLWVNLIMDTFAALALATEQPNPKLMKKPPRHPEDFIIDRQMSFLILGGGVIFIVTMLYFMIYYLNIPPEDPSYRYRLTIFFNTFIFLQFWNMFNAKAFGTGKSVFSSFFSNKAFLIVAVLIFVGQVLMVEFGGNVFRTTPLTLDDWLKIVGGTSLVLWIGEFVRLIKR